MNGHKIASGIFCEGTRPLRKNRSVSRIAAKEKSGYTYETASGIPFWLSRDLIAENGSINLYAYVLNDPINYWDSLGLYPNISFNPYSNGGTFLQVPIGDFSKARPVLDKAAAMTKGNEMLVEQKMDIVTITLKEIVG